MRIVSADGPARYEICQTCEHFRPLLKQCKVCGCFMPAKVLLDPAKCPENKWDGIKKKDI